MCKRISQPKNMIQITCTYTMWGTCTNLRNKKKNQKQMYVNFYFCVHWILFHTLCPNHGPFKIHIEPFAFHYFNFFIFPDSKFLLFKQLFGCFDFSIKNNRFVLCTSHNEFQCNNKTKRPAIHKWVFWFTKLSIKYPHMCFFFSWKKCIFILLKFHTRKKQVIWKLVATENDCVNQTCPKIEKRIAVFWHFCSTHIYQHYICIYLIEISFFSLYLNSKCFKLLYLECVMLFGEDYGWNGLITIYTY